MSDVRPQTRAPATGLRTGSARDTCNNLPENVATERRDTNAHAVDFKLDADSHSNFDVVRNVDFVGWHIDNVAFCSSDRIRIAGR